MALKSNSKNSRRILLPVATSCVCYVLHPQSSCWKPQEHRMLLSLCHVCRVPTAYIVFSAKGALISFHERRSVAVRNISTLVFVQTDKPVYKPDQKENGMVYLLLLSQDPQGNRIAQWLNQTPSFGILQLELVINQGALLGSYQIVVENPPNYNTYHWFTMEEYGEYHCEAYLYTFGQPVQGTVQIRVCRHRYYDPRCNRDSNGICEAVSAQVTGKSVLWATVECFQSNYISVYQARKTITLENVDPYYRRGIPLTGQMKVNDEDGAPLPNGLIFIEFDGEVVANYTTDNNGTAQFSIPTSHLFEPRYKLRVSHQCTEYGWLENYKPEAVHYVQRYFSRTNSFVKIEPVLRELPCGKREAISVHYILNKVQNEELPSKVHFYYLVTGRYSRFSIPLMIDQKAAPRAKLLVYTLHPHGELIADSISFEVEKCFRNKVSLQFSKKEALPASGIGLNLKAASNSFCALRAVDKSVLLLRPGEDLTPESVSPGFLVYSRLPYQELYGYYYNGLNLEDTPKEPCVELKNTFFDAQFYIPVNVTDDGNVYDVFRVCLSLCLYWDCTLRTYFPETFFWQLHWVDSSGKANLSYTVPDTITEWEANAFCMNDNIGFGLSGVASLTAFQPFFVEPAMPYSTIRGEVFLFKGNVFNFLDDCIEVRSSVSMHKCPYYFCSQGDILGTAMKNAENLLPMPYGCAEQNIAMFLSHLYILFYLTDTKQLTEEKKSRILRNLNAGPSALCPFRLTTLVYKAFGQSSPAIFVDENILNQALLWISSKQGPDGCFKSDGKIYNQALEYPVVRAGLSCLDAASDGRVRSTFENALLAHTYGLAGNAEKQKHFLDVLMASATRNGKWCGLLYWKREKRPRVEDFPSFYIRASSLEILMNSYVLLAWLNRPNLSQEDLTVGSQMARWLVRNQNSLGGFSSSQDTPVALLALSRFGNLTFTKDAENTVEISAGGSFKKVFQVTSSNSVLLQQVELPNIPGNYSVEVKGSGCVYIQVNGIPSPQVYTGERNASNMVIFDIKMLSGFVPVSSSLERVKVCYCFPRRDHFSFHTEVALVNLQSCLLPMAPTQIHRASACQQPQ
uniref:Alpha-2-macroglobulin like 1 n=1 Tax=Podarcis muralis TaxID=64176 RepID=A0A670KHM3_PODMU